MDEVGVVAVVGGEAAVGVEGIRNVDSVEEVREVEVVDVVAVVRVVLLAVEQQLVLWADDARVAVPAVKPPPASAGSLGQRSAYHEIMAMQGWERAVLQQRNDSGESNLV